ncbi:MAG TPA: hypothetical protein VNO21_25490, partial [Polyangiaceae bacterium]|nr:hypothetical protein [Polyangiaceae bacterium]
MIESRSPALGGGAQGKQEKRKVRSLASLAGLVAVFVPVLAAHEARGGEPMPTRGDRLASPGRTAASEDSAESLVLNPANLGYLPSWELRWTGIGCSDAPQRVGCGHAVDAAAPLLFGFSTGLRVDFLQTPWQVGFPYSGRDMTWITWGLAYKWTGWLSVGFSIQHSYSGNGYLDALTGLTAGLTLRPFRYLSVAAVAQNFNGPSTAPLGPSQQP